MRAAKRISEQAIKVVGATVPVLTCLGEFTPDNGTHQCSELLHRGGGGRGAVGSSDKTSFSFFVTHLMAMMVVKALQGIGH